jgi:hypothetical protein
MLRMSRCETWGFGETVRLPHPFGFEMSTEHWDHQVVDRSGR